MKKRRTILNYGVFTAVMLFGFAMHAQAEEKKKVEKTLADLTSSELAIIYRQTTGVDLGGEAQSDKPNPWFANAVNSMLSFDTVSRENVAKQLVDLGKPELAKVVLSNGRVDPAAAEALKLGDLLVASGDGAKAVDAYLEAFRIAPGLFRKKYIATFDEQNRIKDLAELFTEEHLSKTRLYRPQIDLLDRLMKDDTRASIGMPYMERQWNARPDMRGFMSSRIPWNEVPNRLDYFRPLLIPEDIETVGTGLYELFKKSKVEGGWLYSLRKQLDEDTVRQLIAEIRPKVQQHENWHAGSVMLAILEALAGNYEPAKQWIEENYESIVTETEGVDRDLLLSNYAEFVGNMLEGKNRELDLLVIKLYEQAIEHRNVNSPYRDTKLHELAKLYHKYGRTNDALALLYSLVERQSEVNEYVSENFENAKNVNLDHERIRDIWFAVGTLNHIGRPMDSLLLLSRIDFQWQRSAGEYKGGGQTPNDTLVDELTSESNKLVSANTIVEALNRGVLPVGLVSAINNESGEIDNPIVELLTQVSSNELSDEVKAAFDQVNPGLAGADAMDQHLAELMKQRPTDPDVAASAAIFAFLRDDTGKAQDRLKSLAAITGDGHKARAADVNLYLAAKYALENKETADLGARLSTRAMQAVEQMNGDWEHFLQSKRADIDGRAL